MAFLISFVTLEPPRLKHLRVCETNSYEAVRRVAIDYVLHEDGKRNQNFWIKDNWSECRSGLLLKEFPAERRLELYLKEDIKKKTWFNNILVESSIKLIGYYLIAPNLAAREAPPPDVPEPPPEPVPSFLRPRVSNEELLEALRNHPRFQRAAGRSSEVKPAPLQ